MNQKLRTRFDSLPAEIAAHVAGILLKKHKDLDLAIPLFDACVKAKIDSADVIVSLASSSEPESVVAMEILSGKSIQKAVSGESDLPPAPNEQGRVASGKSPRKPRSPATPREKSAAPRKSDPRILIWVMPNPKKQGSKSAERYEHYRVGARLDEVVAKDKLRWDDIAWDLERGHIKLGTLADLQQPESAPVEEAPAPEVAPAE